jgi:hypothetical protein
MSCCVIGVFIQSTSSNSPNMNRPDDTLNYHNWTVLLWCLDNKWTQSSVYALWYTSCGTEQPSRYTVHTIPSALLYFGTVCQTGVLHLSILAWRLGHGPLNQTQCFYRRKTEENEIRDAEQAKVKFFIQTIQKRGPWCLTARHYILLMMTSLRSKYKQMQSQFHQ